MKDQKYFSFFGRLPDEIQSLICSKLTTEDRVSARQSSKGMYNHISSYYLTTLQTPRRSSRVLIVSEDDFSLVNLNQNPGTDTVQTEIIRAPLPVTSCSKRTPKESISSNLTFHGSALGVVCLSLNDTSYFLWNPTTDCCFEFPQSKSTFETLFSGIGTVGDGVLEVVRVGVAKGSQPGIGVPIMIDCFSTKNNQWMTLDLAENFLAAEPSYVGVAQNVLVWSYPSIDPTLLCGYCFSTRSVIRLINPPLGPPPFMTASPDEENDYLIRLFLAADTICVLGEDAENGLNYLWNLEGGLVGGYWRFHDDLGLFRLANDHGLVDSLIGSNSDFQKLLVLTVEGHLIVLHPVVHGDNLEITLVEHYPEGADPNTTDSDSTGSVRSVSVFNKLCSIQFQECVFWPWPYLGDGGAKLKVQVDDDSILPNVRLGRT